jgi:hypothetical protein
MSKQLEELQALADKLKEFIGNAGWVAGREAKGLRFYFPPEELGVQGKYSIALPDDLSRPGSAELLSAAASSLANLYGYGRSGDMLEKASSMSVESSPVRFVSRFVDATTSSGSMPLHALTEFLNQTEKGLYNGAKFKLGGDDAVVKAVAARFSKECLFQQTKVGSFIASVEIPKSILRQADLFGREAIESTQVCSAVFSAIEFLNSRILNDIEPIDADDLLTEALVLFDVELLEALAKMIIGPQIESIDFSLELGSTTRTSSTGWINEQKIRRMTDYVSFIKKHLRGEDDIEVTGTIVELRSRDPEGSKNYIRVAAEFNGEKTFVSATLTNEQYQLAVEAHKTKRAVTLRGNGTCLKTQLRITKLIGFST